MAYPFLFRPVTVINAGKTTRVHPSDKAIAMVNNTPIDDVPGWEDNAILPKEPMVVKALNKTALGVDVSNTPSIPLSSRSRTTK